MALRSLTLSTIRALSGLPKFNKNPQLGKSILVTRYSQDSNAASKPQINEATNDDKKLQLIKMEYELEKVAGGYVPSQLSDEHFTELLSLPTRSQRFKYLKYLKKKEVHMQNDMRKKIERKRLIEENAKVRQEEIKNQHLPYGLGLNSIFLQIRDSSIALRDCYSLADSAQFGQKIVFDLGYDEFMDKKDAKNTAQQLKLCYSYNKRSKEPFDLNFCYVNKEKNTYREFESLVPTIQSPRFLTSMTPKSYLDVFPKDKLVYLSPNASSEMVKYDHDAVYIIGAYVDKRVQKPVSFAKAKRQGLKMAKLPLDSYLRWGSGSGKCLTLDQMINILLTMKETGNWEEALKFVPQRKLRKNRF